MESLIGEGINVNVTLMFSLDQYDAVSAAYMSGLERLADGGGDIGAVASVASFFVSRIDVMVDRMLDEIGTPAAQELKATASIVNAKMAYQRFKATFAGDRWERLADEGARVQRVLWASTSTKNPVRRVVERYREEGELSDGGSSPPDSDLLHNFLSQTPSGGSPSSNSDRGYIALQAYVQPTARTDAALLALRTRLRDRYQLATAVGYGPSFLHSTGQLYKGDAGNGVFIQLRADPSRDAGIPDELGSAQSSITFGVLQRAQALGDWQAMEEAGRHVIRFHLGEDVVEGLDQLAKAG